MSDALTDPPGRPGPTVAVVGLGRMGQAMARRIVAAGLPLIVANRSPAVAQEFAERHGVRTVPVSEALAGAEICLTSVIDSDALEQLVAGAEGLLSGEVPSRRVVVDASTVSVDSSRRVATLLGERGVDYLRAPVAGNPPMIDAGKLLFMVSGDARVLARARPVLEAVGPTVLDLGDGEQARAMKLALNTVLAGTAELLVEAVALAQANGVSAERAVEVLGQSVAGSTFLAYKGSALAAGDYTPTATTELLAKDLDLARALARDSRLRLPATELVGELLEQTIELGHGQKDFIALALRLAADGG